MSTDNFKYYQEQFKTYSTERVLLVAVLNLIKEADGVVRTDPFFHALGWEISNRIDRIPTRTNINPKAETP